MTWTFVQTIENADSIVLLSEELIQLQFTEIG